MAEVWHLVTCPGWNRLLVALLETDGVLQSFGPTPLHYTPGNFPDVGVLCVRPRCLQMVIFLIWKKIRLTQEF